MIVAVLTAAAGCNSGTRTAVSGAADDLARALGTSTDDAAKYLDDAARLGVSDDALVQAVRRSSGVADDVSNVIATSSLDEWVRTKGDEVLVSAMCDLLVDAAASGRVPEPGELVEAFASAAFASWSNAGQFIATVTSIAEDVERLYTTAPLGTAYARLLVLRYQYC